MRLNWVNAAHWNERMLGLAMTIRGLPIPVIAMVNGWCMGGATRIGLVVRSRHCVGKFGLRPDWRPGGRLPDGWGNTVSPAADR